MKKVVIIATVFMTIGSISQAALPEGSFQGRGLWKSEKQEGRYEVRSEIQGQSIATTYTLPDGSTKAWNMEMKATENGFFEVRSGGAVVGKGYCLQYVTLCHYEVKTSALSLEETLTVQEGKLYKFGSKTESGITVMWQESLGK